MSAQQTWNTIAHAAPALQCQKDLQHNPYNTLTLCTMHLEPSQSVKQIWNITHKIPKLHNKPGTQPTQHHCNSHTQEIRDLSGPWVKMG